ncbi:DEAD/DEAH box helicase family protein [Polynucleobacter paneuropaeus]|nr:DEAD/DEAH box helicase family protein [Polynucleobacter paneuropaeus]
MASFGEFLGSLDPDAGKRGKQFEHFVKWFLKNDPEWSTQVDQVWLWDEYPNSWGRDCGIDLVFKHKNGENWAVQAKCYAPTTSITKADVDSFISESNRDGIDKRLLIATTDLIGANAKQVCDAQDKPVTRFLLSHFEDADIEYPVTLDDLPKAKRKEKPKPRDHQIEAIEAVTINFKDVDRGQLIMACGTGKTFTTLWIKERLGVESTLVLLPSLGLLSQTLHEWTLAANEEFRVLCICSDESVGKKGSDEAVHSIADLAFPVTSDVNEIRAFLNSSGKKVVFSTYQSSPLIAEAQIDRSIPTFDFAIADEAHRCAGKVSGDFSTILDGDKIRAKKRLFATATPRTYSASVKKAAEDRGVEVVGMDDETVFGKQLFVLNFGEAIERGLLTDYRVVIIGVDDPTISAWIENRELLKADSDIEMDAESLAAQVGLLKAIKDYDLNRIISFHSRVSRAEVFSQDIHKVLSWIDKKHKPSGELKSDFVSGDMPADKRRRKLAQLKSLKDGQRGLLTNARCLSEGVDVPSLDAVAFIDPRSSQIDIIQAVGRAIRLSQNKRAGTIILPVFIDKTDNPEEALDEGSFKPIWDVLNALKAHDDILADELNQLRVGLGRKGGGYVGNGNLQKVKIDIPIGIGNNFSDGLRTLIVEKSSSSWDFHYGLLLQFIDEHGHALIPTNFITTKGHKLGRWIVTQRSSKKTLSTIRKSKLEKISGWSWDSHESQWDIGFRYLEYFVKTYQKVPSVNYVTNDGYKLGSWVNTQKVFYRQNKLSKSRVERLESVPFWSWDINRDDWETSYLRIIEFQKKYGHLNVPENYKLKSGYALGKFVKLQKITKQNLSPEQIQKLEQLNGWIWEIKNNWDIAFEALRRYQITHENLNPKRTLKLQNGERLLYWIHEQQLSRDKLSDEQIKALESIPGWGWASQATNSITLEQVQANKDSMWNYGFGQLKKYLENHPNSQMSISYIDDDGFKLGQWVSLQKSRPDLHQDKRNKLDSLKGFLWNNNEQTWNDCFQSLKDFAEQYGHCNVPDTVLMRNGKKLWFWREKQCIRINRDKLTHDQRSRLESLPGWSWTSRVNK